MAKKLKDMNRDELLDRARTLGKEIKQTRQEIDAIYPQIDEQETVVSAVANELDEKESKLAELIHIVSTNNNKLSELEITK